MTPSDMLLIALSLTAFVLAIVTLQKRNAPQRTNSILAPSKRKTPHGTTSAQEYRAASHLYTLVTSLRNETQSLVTIDVQAPVGRDAFYKQLHIFDAKFNAASTWFGEYASDLSEEALQAVAAFLASAETLASRAIAQPDVWPGSIEGRVVPTESLAVLAQNFTQAYDLVTRVLLVSMGDHDEGRS